MMYNFCWEVMLEIDHFMHEVKDDEIIREYHLKTLTIFFVEKSC